MHFVRLYDNEVEECVEVLCCDFIELQKVINLVHENDNRFLLEGIETKYFIMVDDLEKEIKKTNDLSSGKSKE